MGTVVFDARSVREVPTGLGRVAGNLMRALARIDSENEYVIVQRSSLARSISPSPRFRVVRVPYDIATVRNALWFHRTLRRHRPAVYHSLYSFLPRWIPSGIRTVVTVHDFMWIQRPSASAAVPWKGWVNGLYGRPMHAHTVGVADHLACISAHTAGDLRQLFPDCDGPISVIQHGVDCDEFEAGKTSSRIQRYGGSRFILSIGHGRPYKNPEATLRAFARIRRESRHADIRLVMAGRADTRSRLAPRIRAAGLTDAVDFTGPVSNADLAYLLRSAQLLSFPSRWEGFGLPVIEAFAFGCPVVASRRGALKEIAEGTAWMLDDPESDEELAAAMSAIINDRGTRERLRARGFQRATGFTWERAARSYLDIYRSLMMSSPRSLHGPGPRPPTGVPQPD